MNQVTNVAIKKLGGMYFVDFFNSKEVYSTKGFDTERKAKNFCKKYGYKVHDRLPEGVEFELWD